MINITRNKRKYQGLIVNQNLVLEAIFLKRIAPLLIRQWTGVRNLLKQGVAREVDAIIDLQHNKLYKEFVLNYKRVGKVCFNLIEDRVEELNKKSFVLIQKKDTENVFWTTYNKWLAQYAAEQVVKVQSTTKKVLKKIIDKGVREGKTYEEIAEGIGKVKQISNIRRARTIVRTEVHTSFNKSTLETVSAADMEVGEKEWMSAMDERTRIEPFNHLLADGEKVGLNDFFVRTEQRLQYPGDPNGSAANIINCRCINLYSSR